MNSVIQCYGFTTTLLPYFGQYEAVVLQGLNRQMYKLGVGRVQTKFSRGYTIKVVFVRYRLFSQNKHDFMVFKVDGRENMRRIRQILSERFNLNANRYVISHFPALNSQQIYTSTRTVGYLQRHGHDMLAYEINPQFRANFPTEDKKNDDLYGLPENIIMIPLKCRQYTSCNRQVAKNRQEKGKFKTRMLWVSKEITLKQLHL